MRLRVKLLGGGPGEVGPGHVALPEVVGAVRGVPGVVTARPGQGAREGGVEVVESPGDDGVVVEGDVEADDADGKANAWEKQDRAQPWGTALGTGWGSRCHLGWGSLTFKDGADALPDGDGTCPVELPQGQLHVEEGHPPKNSHQRVGDEEGSCRVGSTAG